jgi:hypothetical protein
MLQTTRSASGKRSGSAIRRVRERLDWIKLVLEDSPDHALLSGDSIREAGRTTRAAGRENDGAAADPTGPMEMTHGGVSQSWNPKRAGGRQPTADRNPKRGKELLP